MRRLIVFEWRKSFLHLPVLLLLVLFTVSDIAKIYDVYHENSYLAMEVGIRLIGSCIQIILGK